MAGKDEIFLLQNMFMQYQAQDYRYGDQDEEGVDGPKPNQSSLMKLWHVANTMSRWFGLRFKTLNSRSKNYGKV